MTALERIPPRLRDTIARDLRPVRPLRSPWVRALLLLPLAAAMVVGIPVYLEFRPDLRQVGVPMSWGLSLLEVAAGVLLIAAAFRQAVPGRGRGARALVGLATAAGALIVTVNVSTYFVSPTYAPPHLWQPFNLYCARGSMIAGLPLLLVAAWLVHRALPLQPAITGALYGFGVGLVADAGWRLFCEVSDPSHVLLSHAGAVGLLTILGLGLGRLLASRR